MTMITCLRGSGAPELPAVVDPLLCTDVARAERGRVELDRAARGATLTIRAPFDPAIERGQIIDITDTETGQEERGIVDEFEMVQVVGGVKMTIKLWVPEVSQ